MSEPKASRQERLVLGVLLVGTFLLVFAMFANTPMVVQGRDVHPDAVLSREALAIGVVTLLLASGIAVRSYGYREGAKLVAVNAWSGLLAGGFLAMTAGFALRAIVPPGLLQWLLAASYAAAMAFVWWFASQAPWEDVERAISARPGADRTPKVPPTADQRMRGWAEGTMVTALWLGMFAIFGLLFAVLGWEDAGKAVPVTDVISSGGAALELVGAPGETLRFRLTGKVLGSARWRSKNGLAVNIANQSQVVVPPRTYDWGEAITVGRSTNDSLDIKATLTVPMSLAVGQTASGTLLGELVTAQARGGAFRNEHDTLRVPVYLSVVSAADSADYRAKREGRGRMKMRIGMLFAAIAAALGMITGITSWTLYRRLRLVRL